MKTFHNLILSLTYLLLLQFHANAQEVRFRPHTGSGNYGVSDTFPAIGVADDFGPRMLGTRNWHGGKFITRIHKSDPMDGAPAVFSYCPMSTRYNDGRYQLKARVVNVRNAEAGHAVQDITIDNTNTPTT